MNRIFYEEWNMNLFNENRMNYHYRVLLGNGMFVISNYSEESSSSRTEPFLQPQLMKIFINVQ